MLQQAIKEVMKANEETVQPVDRHEMIAVEAYLRAEQRGFQGGDPVADWLDAETEIDSALTTNT